MKMADADDVSTIIRQTYLPSVSPICAPAQPMLRALHTTTAHSIMRQRSAPRFPRAREMVLATRAEECLSRRYTPADGDPAHAGKAMRSQSVVGAVSGRLDSATLAQAIGRAALAACGANVTSVVSVDTGDVAGRAGLAARGDAGELSRIPPQRGVSGQAGKRSCGGLA